MGASGVGFAKGTPFAGTATASPIPYPDCIDLNIMPVHTIIMPRKMVNLNEDVYNALVDLKYEWRERSLNDVLEHLLHEIGYEPFDEAGFEDE